MKKQKKIKLFKSLLKMCVASLNLSTFSPYRKELNSTRYIIHNKHQQHYKNRIFDIHYLLNIGKQTKYTYKKIHNILNYSTHQHHNLYTLFSLITLKYIKKYRYLYHKYYMHTSSEYRLQYIPIISKTAIIQTYILYKLLNTKNKFFIYKTLI